MGNAAKALIVTVWLIFSFPYWGKGLVPFPSTYLVTFFAPWSASYGMPVKNNAMPDVITQIFPWKRVTIDSWKNGEVPLWNPYSFSGTSHVGNYQSAVFSPINILFLLLPEIHAWSIMILLQPLLAGMFMYVFLRSLRVSLPGSTLGALAFMFCGFIVVWMAYGTLSYAVLFLPLILYGITTRKGAIVSTAIALSFLSGHFQMSLYVLIYGFTYIVYKKEWSMLWFVIFGLGLAAPQILPAFDSYTNAVRSTIFAKGEVIPWRYFVTIFSPDFYGNPVTRNDWFGHYAEWASYIGVASLMLATLSNQRFFILMTIIPLFLAYQTPLVDLLFLSKIPVLSTSAASRIIVLASFSLCVLAAFGLDELSRLWEKRSWKKIRIWSSCLAFLVVGLWVTLLILKPLPPEKLAVSIRNSILPTIIFVASCAIIGLGFLINKKHRIILQLFLIAIVVFDMVRFASKWMPFDPAKYVYPNLPVLQKLQSLVGLDKSRVFGNIGNEAGPSFKLSFVEGYDALYQYRYGRFISTAHSGKAAEVGRSVVQLDKHGAYTEDILKLLGVKYYAHKKSDGRFPWAYPFWEFPQYNRIWEDEHFEILENTKSFPRTFLVSAYRIETEDQKILDAMYSENIRDTVILEKEPGISPELGEGVASITSYRPTEVTVNTQSDVPKILFLSDVYDVGWRVTIDGIKTELLRANFAFRAVSLPAGSHTVRMWYAPMSVTLGYIMAGFATLGIIGFYIWKRNH